MHESLIWGLEITGLTIAGRKGIKREREPEMEGTGNIKVYSELTHLDLTAKTAGGILYTSFPGDEIYNFLLTSEHQMKFAAALTFDFSPAEKMGGKRALPLEVHLSSTKETFSCLAPELWKRLTWELGLFASLSVFSQVTRCISSSRLLNDFSLSLVVDFNLHF